MGYTANAQLQDLFDEAPLIRSIDRLTLAVGDELKEEVVRRTPVADPPAGVSRTQFAGSRGRAPGTLARSWYRGQLEYRRSATGLEGRAIEVATDDPIAEHVEFPTRPHLIRPSPSRRAASVVPTRRPRRSGSDPQAALRWLGPGGVPVFAREVHHPGTQGSYMMRDSLAEIDATWDEKIGFDEVTRWAREQAALVR